MWYFINNKYSWNFHTNQTFPLSILYKDKLYYKKGCYLYDKEEIVLYQPGTLSIYNNYLVFKKEDSLFIYKDFKLIKNYTLNKNEKLIDIIDNQLVIKTDWTISLENLV